MTESYHDIQVFFNLFVSNHFRCHFLSISMWKKSCCRSLHMETCTSPQVGMINENISWNNKHLRKRFKIRPTILLINLWKWFINHPIMNTKCMNITARCRVNIVLNAHRATQLYFRLWVVCFLKLTLDKWLRSSMAKLHCIFISWTCAI